MTDAHPSSKIQVCQYCNLALEGYEHATGLDCLDAMEADRDRLRAALAALVAKGKALEWDDMPEFRDAIKILEGTADETTPVLVVPPKHPLAGTPGTVVNKPLDETPARPFGWYREGDHGECIFHRGDWPPPEPDDTAWVALYDRAQK